MLNMNFANGKDYSDDGGKWDANIWLELAGLVTVVMISLGAAALVANAFK
jgi:hypothetical protein